MPSVILIQKIPDVTECHEQRFVTQRAIVKVADLTI